MKRILTIAVLAIGMMACSNDDELTPTPAAPTCNCDKVFERNTLTLTNGVWVPSGWVLVNNSYPNFTTDCTLNDQISNQQSQGNGQTTVLTRFRIICR
jgi:hypothetical protein